MNLTSPSPLLEFTEFINDYYSSPIEELLTPQGASGRWSRVASAKSFACALDAETSRAYCWGCAPLHSLLP